MWVLKSKFSMALIIAIILTLSLIAVWYVTPVPKVSPLIVSDVENLDFISSMEGEAGGLTPGGVPYWFPKVAGYGVFEFPIGIKAHVRTSNGTIRLQNTTAINMTNPVCSNWSAVSEANVLLDKKYHILSWKDIDKDEKLSSSDRINLNKTEPAPVGPRWYDLQEVWKYGAFCNMIALPRMGDNLILMIEANMFRADTIRLQNETAINMSNPVCTKWNAISEPDVNVPLRKYHILSWKDIDKDGELSSSDRIHMDMTHPVLKRWCDVQDVEYGAICYVDITNMSIPDFSGNSTYVFNKLTRKNVQDAPEASKNRTGYDPLYPSHLKPGEPIHDVWLDNLNTTGTLEFVKTVQIEDVELYEYFLNKTFTKELIIPDVSKKLSNYTLTNTKNVLIEPLSGLPVYTINETVKIVKNFTDPKTGELYLTPIAYITYKDKGEIDLVTPRLAHGAMKVLEFDKVVKGWILGAIVVILTVAFIFNIGSLARARKMPPKAET